MIYDKKAVENLCCKKMENKNSNFLNSLPDLHNNQDNLLNIFYSATRLPWIWNHNARLWAKGSICHKSSGGNLTDAFRKSFPFRKNSAKLRQPTGQWQSNARKQQKNLNRQNFDCHNWKLCTPESPPLNTKVFPGTRTGTSLTAASLLHSTLTILHIHYRLT